MSRREVLFVVTADQIGSRHDDDLVPAALAALSGQPGWARSFRRTVGDEVQGVTGDASAVVRAVETVAPSGHWRLGIGVGAVERPLPRDVRAARGPAFYAARAAIGAARTNVADLRVASLPEGGADAERATSALMLLAFVLRRRTDRSAQVVALLDDGLTGREVAGRLGISPTAVSQHKIRAGWDEQLAARDLATHHLTALRDHVATLGHDTGESP